MIKAKNFIERHFFRGAPTLSRTKRRSWTISASACARRPPVKAGLLAKRWKKSAGESLTMADLVMTNAGAVLLRPEHPFQALVDMIADTLSPSSRRVYRHTYDSWRAFADRYQIVYLDLSFAHVSAFLQDTDVAHEAQRAPCFRSDRGILSRLKESVISGSARLEKRGKTGDGACPKSIESAMRARQSRRVRVPPA